MESIAVTIVGKSVSAGGRVGLAGDTVFTVDDVDVDDVDVDVDCGPATQYTGWPGVWLVRSRKGSMMPKRREGEDEDGDECGGVGSSRRAGKLLDE